MAVILVGELRREDATIFESWREEKLNENTALQNVEKESDSKGTFHLPGIPCSKLSCINLLLHLSRGEQHKQRKQAMEKMLKSFNYNTSQEYAHEQSTSEEYHEHVTQRVSMPTAMTNVPQQQHHHHFCRPATGKVYNDQYYGGEFNTTHHYVNHNNHHHVPETAKKMQYAEVQEFTEFEREESYEVYKSDGHLKHRHNNFMRPVSKGC